VASVVGSELARRLVSAPEFEHVAGLDTRRPRDIDGVEFVEVDIRDPELTTVVAEARADTLVHNQIVRQPRPDLSARAMHDLNVMGSLQVVAACERSESLRAVVVRGSAGIYGAEPQAPQFLTEQMARLYPLRSRFQRDVGEIETYFHTYARRHPDVACTMLRFQPSIGPGLDTQVTRYLSAPVAPTYLGFDPRIQLVHSLDALDALVAAVRNPVRGPVNVAAPGTIGLTRMVRMAGRPALPIAAPLFGPMTRSLTRIGVPSLSEDFTRLLRYGRAVDTRRLSEDIGFNPRRDTAAAVADYLEHRGNEGSP